MTQIADEERLRALAEESFEPRHFGEQDSEFGYWFGLDEDYPRGQLSGLMICADVGDPGAWSSVFNQPNLTKFDQPTVAGVDFPRLGISRAYNDPDGGVLRVSTYGSVASSGDTKFRVEQLSDASAVEVRLDGEVYTRWRPLGDRSIEIDTTYSQHDFEISTGPSAKLAWAATTLTGTSVGAGAMSGSAVKPSPPSASSFRAANRLVSSGGGLCPCCA